MLFFGLSKNVSAKKFTILLPSQSEHILYSYIWIAKEKGFFEQEGLDVEISVNDDASIPAQVSLDPDYPVGVIAIESLFEKEIYAQNIIPFMFFLYGASETSTYDTHLVVSKKSGIKSADGLKGRTIRVGFPPTKIALKNILKEAGLELSDVKLNNAEAHQTLDLIRSGEIDGGITYFPTMPVMLASGDVDVLKRNIFSNYVMNYVPQSFIAVNKDFAAENPAIIRKFLQAMDNAVDYGAENPVEIIKSYGKLKSFGKSSWILDEDLIEKGAALIPEIPIKELDDFYVEDGKKETIYEVLNEYQDLLQKEGYIKDKINLQPLWDNYLAFKSFT